MDFTFVAILMILLLPILFILQQRGVNCPQCDKSLPKFVAPWKKTRRQWIKGGFFCTRCRIELDMQGNRISGDEPPISTAVFLRVLVPTLLAPVILLIVLYIAFFWGEEQIKSYMLEPEVHAAEPLPAASLIPDLPIQRMPKETEQEGLRARLVLREHEPRDNQNMYSLGLEIQNAGHSGIARVDFDPEDLELELLDAQGALMPQGPIVANGPIQGRYQVFIFGNSSVTLSVHDHGYGFAGRIWANDHTAWSTPPGEYQVRGSVTVTVSYARPLIEGPFGNVLKIPYEWEEKSDRVKLEIPLSRFRLIPHNG